MSSYDREISCRPVADHAHRLGAHGTGMADNLEVRRAGMASPLLGRRYGHLMEGLDDRTADRLDAIAEFSRGPGVAQSADEADTNQPESPLTRGDNWQSRAGSNRRFRLERPAS